MRAVLSALRLCHEDHRAYLFLQFVPTDALLLDDTVKPFIGAPQATCDAIIEVGSVEGKCSAERAWALHLRTYFIFVHCGNSAWVGSGNPFFFASLWASRRARIWIPESCCASHCDQAFNTFHPVAFSTPRPKQGMQMTCWILLFGPLLNST